MSTKAERKTFVDKLAGCICDEFRKEYIKLYKEGGLTKWGRALAKQAIEHDTDDAWTWFARHPNPDGKKQNIRNCPVHDKRKKAK